MDPSCDVGGKYYYEWDGGVAHAVYFERCLAPPTHQYRGSGFAEGHWSYRCAKHVRWLDRSVCTIEELVVTP